MNIQSYPGGWDQEPGNRPFIKRDPATKDHDRPRTIDAKNSLELLRQATFNTLFEEQALRHGGRTAVQCGAVLTTYRKLNDEANRLAGHFINYYDVQPGDSIGLLLDRTDRMLIGLLAAMKAGAICVPIEPAYPQARKDFIAGDAQLKLVVTQRKYSGELRAYCREVVFEDLPVLPLMQGTKPVAHPADVAYIMYTSGSTGKPKGVLIEHRSVVDLALWQRDYFKTDEPRRISQMSSFSFDGAIGECVMALTSGSTLVIIPNDDFMELISIINNEKIDIVVTGPSILKELCPEDLERETTIISVGERCPETLYERWRTKCRFVNGYGPTEYSVYSHVWHGVDKIETAVPIGKGRTHLKTYIADENFDLCHVGVLGEILLSGPGLARAYLNNAEQNFKSFIPNRFHLQSLFKVAGEVENIAWPDAILDREALPESLIDEVSQQIREKSSPGTLLEEIVGQFSGRLLEDTLRLLRVNDTDIELKRAFLRYYFEGKFHTYKAYGITWEAFRVLMGNPNQPGMKGADLGCGSGEFLQSLAVNGIQHVTGVDINPFFVQGLTDRGIRAAIARIDSPTEVFTRESGLLPESLDFVISTLTLDRVQHPRQLIRNMSAVLKDGGRFMLGTLLPIVEFEDGANRSDFAYTRYENKLTPGVDADDDKFYVIQEMVSARITGLQIFTVKIHINSKNGLQPYDLKVFCGNKDYTVEHDDYTRLYKTGDYGRWLHDGNIEFVGRLDDQVKVHGHRIELGEVESVLLRHPVIESAAVMTRPGPQQENQLVAFVIARHTLTVESLRSWLKEIVPPQMIPHVIKFVTRFQLTNSGKVDKAALLRHDRAEDRKIVSEGTMTPAMRATILDVWNNTSRAIPHLAVHKLFEQKAAIDPGRSAIHFNDLVSLSYGELNTKANKLAHFLAKVVHPGDQVGILMEENTDAITAMVATLKCGCAYVPLDPGYPGARLGAMLDDGQIRTIVTIQDYEALLDQTGSGARRVYIDRDARAIESEATDNLHSVVGNRDLAYVMYTSGTTGIPKKVGVEHRSIVRLVKNTNYWQYGPKQSRILKTGAFAFDASTFEVWAMLLNGGEIFLYPKKQLLDPQFLREKITEHQVPLMWVTTSWFNYLIDIDPEIFKPLRTLLIGGEKASVKHVNRLTEHCPHLELINAYGPTENTTFSTFYRVAGVQSDTLPVGIPISNSRVYVLDQDANLLPPGIDGEVYVGGLGVARGYLNDESLTAQRFFPDPFFPGERMYRTGDIGRWLENGMILLKGRTDGQVKLRGHRIETGEVENKLRALPGITDAAVLVREHNGQKELVAAFIANAVMSGHEVRSELAAQIPDFMIPAQFFQVAEWPINMNGKLDREKLLQQIPVPVTREEAMLAMSSTMRELVLLWEESLDQPHQSIDDNFFHVGGDSLLAMKLVAKIKERFNITMPVSILFEAPTISKLAAIIESEVKTKAVVVSRVGIVPIQTEGSKPPLFVIPGYLFYHHLSRHLGKDQPVYGFEPVPKLSTRDAAAFYIGQMREVQSRGPYFIGGYCAGGIIAYEIARQLKDAGESVGLLALFETYTSEGVVPKTSMTYMREKMKLLKNRFTSSSIGDMLGILKKEISRTVGFAGDYFRNLAGDRYEIQPYNGKIAFFVASDGMVGSAKDPLLGWGRYCNRQHVEVNEVPGNHDTMFKEPHVQVLAGRLKEMLRHAHTASGVTIAAALMLIGDFAITL
jgi:amino acid adenylation domain-containing protein